MFDLDVLRMMRRRMRYLWDSCWSERQGHQIASPTTNTSTPSATTTTSTASPNAGSATSTTARVKPCCVTSRNTTSTCLSNATCVTPRTTRAASASTTRSASTYLIGRCSKTRTRSRTRRISSVTWTRSWSRTSAVTGREEARS